MVTLSAPLRGEVPGVVAADLKLDTFSELVQAQRPGAHGTAVVFDEFGALIAYSDFARLVRGAPSHSEDPQLPNIGAIRTGPVGAVMRRWDGSAVMTAAFAATTDDDTCFVCGNFLARPIQRLLAAAGGGRRFRAAGAQFADQRNHYRTFRRRLLRPAGVEFGGRMSTALQRITGQASRLQALAAPDDAPVTSRIAEIHELGRVMAVARRSIWSFARFVPKDIVKGIIDGSISTELGGVRQEITILFTDSRISPECRTSRT